MERVCHRQDCHRATFVVFDQAEWCRGHFLERVAETDTERATAAEVLASTDPVKASPTESAIPPQQLRRATS